MHTFGPSRWPRTELNGRHPVPRRPRLHGEAADTRDPGSSTDTVVARDVVPVLGGGMPRTRSGRRRGSVGSLRAPGTGALRRGRRPAHQDQAVLRPRSRPGRCPPQGVHGTQHRGADPTGCSRRRGTGAEGQQTQAITNTEPRTVLAVPMCGDRVLVWSIHLRTRILLARDALSERAQTSLPCDTVSRPSKAHSLDCYGRRPDPLCPALRPQPRGRVLR